MAVDQNQAREAVGQHDMFFSTTDRRGVITQANDVFTRIAGHAHDALVGAPHNIIRHPEMPGGAFRLVWSALLAGRATAAYVLNRAADGSAYWAFASLVPLGEGFISVRTRPLRHDVLDTVWAVYEDARRAELDARSGGASAADAAKTGEDRILELLGERGFDSYDAFVRFALPAEVEARAAALGPLPERSMGDPALLETRAAAADIERIVRRTAIDLAASHTHADELRARIDGAERGVHALADEMDSARTSIEALGRNRVELLIEGGAPLRDRCLAVDATLQRVTDRVGALTVDRANLRASAAVAQMQSEMMVRFVDALLDGRAHTGETGAAIRSLASAVGAGLAAMSADLDADRVRFDEARAEVDASGSATRIMDLTVTAWRRMIDTYDVAGEVPNLGELDAALATTKQELGGIAPALDATAGDHVALDRATLQSRLARVESAARSVG